jgi:hypothetical protein
MADGIYVDPVKVSDVATVLADSYRDPAELVKAARDGAKLRMWPDGEYTWFFFGDLSLGRVPLEFVKADWVPNEA